MLADLGTKVKLGTALGSGVQFFQKPVLLISSYDTANLRPDVLAGLTVAVVLLPQAIAYALIAELPPQVGIYTAIVAAIVGALWGSSNHLQNGPTNAISLLILSTLLTVSAPGNPEFVILAGMMAVMVGLFQVAVGMARLGMLVNFVSHSVIVGFTSGAGVLIALKQVRNLFGLEFESHTLAETVQGIIVNLPDSHTPTVILGLSTMVFIILLRRFVPKLPGPLIGMVAAAAAVAVLELDRQGVSVIPSLPRGLPPLADLPLLNLELIGKLSAGALAVAAIGLVEALSIARSIAGQTGQRLDTNQEFVGQGLANITSGLFSGYPCSGSFTRSAVNFKAGARTPMASVFSGVFVLIAMFALGSFAVYVPHTALAAVLILIAYGMIDRAEIRRIWRGTKGDAVIMLMTFLGTLFLEIEFAVLTGILISFARYIMRTSAPRVTEVSPDSDFKHFTHQPDSSCCPQLGVIDIRGDLYFGAVNHVEEAILRIAERNQEQRHLLLRMNRVNHCDFSGIHMLESVVRAFRDRGGDVYMVRVGERVLNLMNSTGFCDYLVPDNFLVEDGAISYLFHRVLDPAICIYECPVRVFKECQNLPKRDTVVDIPLFQEIPDGQIADISCRELWDELHNGSGGMRPLVIDVREPREYRHGHVPEAELVPLPYILEDAVKLPRDRQIILVCRSGRRSRRAAYALQQVGIREVTILRGGILAWKAAGLLEAVE
jgi:SulP family sulfate permease